MNNRVLTIVVTYTPSRELLKKNISAIIDDVDWILIWENTPEGEKLQYRYICDSKVEYCGDGINSISHALNYAWKYAEINGYDYLLTMDQDSVWDDFKTYRKKVMSYIDKSDRVLGPNAYYSSINKLVECDHIITSGMLLKIDTINKIGGWNETFSIDCVDDEFCLRAKRKGIKSFYIGDCILHQTYGNPCQVKFFWKTIVLRNDSPERLYSIYRSHVILVRMFPEFKTVKKELVNFWIPLIKWTLLFEKQRLKKFLAINKGIIQGLFFRISVREK